MKVGTIEIHDIIGGDYYYGVGVTAKAFVRDFKALEESGVEKIIISINSPGGSISDGVAIFNKIQSSKVKTECQVIGIAYSMAAVISQAGDETTAYKNCPIMFHNGWGWTAGNAQDMREYAKVLDTMDNSLALSIASKTKQTVDEVKAELLDYKDHWMTGEEAHGKGLVNTLLDGESKVVTKDMVNMTFADAMAMFAKHEDTGIVTQLMNKVNGIYNKMVALGSSRTSETQEINTTEITDMNIEQTIDKLLAATGEEAVALRKVLVDAYKQTEIITPEDVIAENAIAVAIVEEKLKQVQLDIVNLTTERDQWKTKAEELGAKPPVEDAETPVAGDDKFPKKNPVAANPWDTAKEEVVAKAAKQADFRKAAALVD